ncbi:MAG: thymidine phosphorylase family protein [Gammaproteobacteria bacterium]|nr:thymidine phosphorylase family protein [Gammaproteobacteria bacterium]
MQQNHKPTLKLRRLGIDTYKEPVIYIREDSYICEAEGFEAQTRIRVSIKNNHQTIIATLNTVQSNLLELDEVSLSEYAWELLGAKEGDEVQLVHPEPLNSLSDIRGKIYGRPFTRKGITEIVKDIAAGRFSDIHVASFLTSCAGDRLNEEEISLLTEAMVDVGERIVWPCGNGLVVDKHCVGGLPGNRTTLIVVPIVAAFGLTIPKTSSRAITSSAGTADTMETLAPVDLSFQEMQNVVAQEKGCIVWGGSVSLSPADDVMIRVERAIDLDSEGQLVASVLSKKIAAGSKYVVIDMPIGPTAKVRTLEKANKLKNYMEDVGKQLGICVYVVFTDGTQPIGRGMGPALEAKDVLAILQRQKDAPLDLRDRALMLAGHVLEFSPDIKKGAGQKVAAQILDSGQAWEKFQRICEAQGGMRTPPTAQYRHDYLSGRTGEVVSIDNRRIARVAKLAGAPTAKAAGVVLHTPIGTKVQNKQPLFTIHAESKGELDYVLAFIEADGSIVEVQ